MMAHGKELLIESVQVLEDILCNMDNNQCLTSFIGVQRSRGGWAEILHVLASICPFLVHGIETQSHKFVHVGQFSSVFFVHHVVPS